MRRCRGCGCDIDPEGGRGPDDDAWCMPCWYHKRAKEDRQRLASPREVVTDTPEGRLVSYQPQIRHNLFEHAPTYLRTFGLVGNVWAAWLMQRGMLDDWHDPPVAEQDFGDPESRQLAARLGVPIDSRKYAR